MTPPVPLELGLPIAERAKISILLVEDNAINQQIALKTIRKLGFAVSPVWNGKEALDYLLAADSPNPPHPKPDLILMDVQMPVIDGYRATHLIRHHTPYKVTSREIPIVAMTASAIQGDREKCKKAGMDDYLAKPVKGKTLEKMIVKWVVNKRIPLTPGSSEHGGSECSEPGDNNCHARSPVKHTQNNEFPVKKREGGGTDTENTRPTMSDRQTSHRLTLPDTETEGDRAERRNIFEEKARKLRDEKLVDAAGPGKGRGLVSNDGERQDQGQKLTVENVGKLEREGKRESQVRKIKRGEMGDGFVLGGDGDGDGSADSDSDDYDGGDDDDAPRSSTERERPRIERRWQDSQRTVTAHDD